VLCWRVGRPPLVLTFGGSPGGASSAYVPGGAFHLGPSPALTQASSPSNFPPRGGSKPIPTPIRARGRRHAELARIPDHIGRREDATPHPATAIPATLLRASQTLASAGFAAAAATRNKGFPDQRLRDPGR
jgi:hypothetical protein